MKKYQIILADPPWNIGSMVLKKWKSPLKDKYPTMTIGELKVLPVGKIADINCGLFLWTTHTTLPNALELMKTWGFKYHCVITWDKGGGWCVAGFYRRTEMCLYGYKGKINVNQKGKFIPTLITEPKRRHSQKPDVMRKWIESNSPQPRIELFARQKTEGWDVWGNEVVSDIEL